MSDTGGGHRSSAEAIREALERELDSNVRVKIIDVFLEYSPYPFRCFPAWYPKIISRGSGFWGHAFHLTNGFKRTKGLHYAAWPLLRPTIERLIRDSQADLMVSVHPMLVGPTLRGLKQTRIPFVTVVTDLLTTHAFWFDDRADLTIVPTETARIRALECGLDTQRVKVVGIPISQRFNNNVASRAELRRELGWSSDLYAVLLLGGGDGIGPLRAIAAGLANSGLPIQLAVVCGRNESLRSRLDSETWPTKTHIYGFVSNMPRILMASDLVISKAGPSSVTEVLTSGRPLVLCSAVPGQEEGNVRYVLENGAGLWAETPDEVVVAVRSLMCANHHRKAEMEAKAKQLARPDAARIIAQQIFGLMRKTTVS